MGTRMKHLWTGLHHDLYSLKVLVPLFSCWIEPDTPPLVCPVPPFLCVSLIPTAASQHFIGQNQWVFFSSRNSNTEWGKLDQKVVQKGGLEKKVASPLRGRKWLTWFFRVSGFEILISLAPWLKRGWPGLDGGPPPLALVSPLAFCQLPKPGSMPTARGGIRKNPSYNFFFVVLWNNNNQVGESICMCVCALKRVLIKS